MQLVYQCGLPGGECREGKNSRHLVPKTSALSAELRGHKLHWQFTTFVRENDNFIHGTSEQVRDTCPAISYEPIQNWCLIYQMIRCTLKGLSRTPVLMENAPDMADKPKKPRKTNSIRTIKATRASRQKPRVRKSYINLRPRYDRKFHSLSTSAQYEELRALFGWLFAPICVIVIIIFAWQW